MKRLLYATLALIAVAVIAAPVATLAQAKAPAGAVILKGAPMGGVKFDHPAHVKAAGGDAKCDTCHHASKPEKAGDTKAKCQTCHTKTATAPMKTKAQAAFHAPMADKGLCVDCHVKEAAAGKKVPAVKKCADCHKKENA
jgi:hypothetical protein